MAVWHCGFLLLPAKCKIYKKEFNIEEAWIGLDCRKKIINIVNYYFEEKDSWDEEMIRWECGNENCLELWSLDNEIYNFIVKIDLRFDFISFVDSIVEICNKLDINIFAEGDIFEPSKECIQLIIEKSSAFKFVQDPKRFLELLS